MCNENLHNIYMRPYICRTFACLLIFAVNSYSSGWIMGCKLYSCKLVSLYFHCMSKSAHCLALLFAICMACVWSDVSKYVYGVYPKYVCCTCSVFTAFERKQESYVSGSMLCNLNCHSPQKHHCLLIFSARSVFAVWFLMYEALCTLIKAVVSILFAFQLGWALGCATMGYMWATWCKPPVGRMTHWDVPCSSCKSKWLGITPIF